MRLFFRVFIVLLLQGAPAYAQSGEPERKIRNVTPENIPVIILPPRKQEGPRTPENEEPIAGDGVTVQLAEDGIVLSDGRRLRFAGIVSIPNDTLCETASGVRWACGLRAFVALRNFIHGKQITCEAVGTAGARCFRERVNVSEWMVGEGWAFYDQTARDEALKRLADDAQKNVRGIWANGSKLIAPEKR